MAVAAIDINKNYDTFYNYDRTPTYAVKFLNEAIESQPIIESQLLRHGLLSVRNYVKHPPPQCLRLSGGPLSAGKWSCDVEHNRYNKLESGHTKTSILREKLIQSKGIVKGRKCTNVISKPITPQELKKTEYSYGFLVGAKYTKHNFVSASSEAMTAKLSNRITLIDSNNDKITTPLVDPKSPPNSPVTVPQDNKPQSPHISIPGDIIAKDEEDIPKPIISVPKKIYEKTSLRPKTAKNPQTTSMFIRSNLPYVRGYGFITPTQQRFHRNSANKTSWTTAELNLIRSKSGRISSQYQKHTRPHSVQITLSIR